MHMSSQTATAGGCIPCQHRVFGLVRGPVRQGMGCWHVPGSHFTWCPACWHDSCDVVRRFLQRRQHDQKSQELDRVKERMLKAEGCGSQHDSCRPWQPAQHHHKTQHCRQPGSAGPAQQLPLQLCKQAVRAEGQVHWSWALRSQQSCAAATPAHKPELFAGLLLQECRSSRQGAGCDED